MSPNEKAAQAIETLDRLRLQEALAAGADPNATSGKKTLLGLACQEKSITFVRLLLLAGAEPNLAGDDGASPLHTCAVHGVPEELVSALLAAGADLEGQNNLQETPLACACEKAESPMVEILLTAGAKVNPIDIFGSTPAHIAAFYGMASHLKRLKAFGAPAQVLDNDNATVLHHLVLHNLPDILADWIEETTINQTTKTEGQTPLHLAIERKHLENVKTLLAHRASLNVRDHEGKTPLETARQQNHPDIVQALEQELLHRRTQSSAAARQTEPELEP